MNLFSLGSASWFKETINLLMLWLCDMLYRVIGLLYQVFVSITQVNLFDRETFTQITRNMYVVMGIAMLFIFAYNIVLMIINPDDKKSTGSTTKVVKETIISLVLVILLPTIFNWMYIFQNNIINSGIITSIILNNVGSNDNVDTSCNYSDYGFDNYATYSGTGIIKGQGSFGVDNKIDEITQECNKFNTKTQKFKSLKGAYLVAPTILSAFYRPTNFTYDDCVTFVEQNHASGDFGTDDDKQICINYYYDVEYSKLSGDTSKFTKDKYLINSATDDTKEGMELNALFAIVSGVIAAIMYFSYCIEIGVRVAKLGVLQILSPIAVMLRIVPKQKEAFFDKWFKNVKDTYLDVFIRLLIINFALFAVSLIPGVIKTLFSSIGDIDSNGVIQALATVFIILGILQFGKECPDLIKEFFGNSGRFSVKNSLGKLKSNANAAFGLGAGAIGAGVVGGFRNAASGKGIGKAFSAVGGAASGFVRGAKAGYKNGFTNSKTTISNTADTVQALATKHRASRARGISGNLENAWDNIAENWSSFGKFMTGTAASSEVGNAANKIMNNISTMESDFSNANIKNIEAGRSEIMKNFNADKEFEFAGNHYKKISATEWGQLDSNGNLMKDSNGNIIKTLHGDLGKEIVNSFKNRIAAAYGQNEMKAGIKEGYERANDALVKNLREALPKLGDGFSTELFNNLNKLEDINGNAMNLDVHSIDDLERKMKSMMATAEGRANLYKVTDEIKGAAKGMKLSNDQAMKAQQAQKDKNKSSNK